MDREAWRATVHRVTQNQTQLKRFSMHACNRSKPRKSGPETSWDPVRFRKEGEKEGWWGRRKEKKEKERKKREILVLLEPAGSIHLARVPLSPHLPVLGLLSRVLWRCFLNQDTMGDHILPSVRDFSSCTLLFSSFYFFLAWEAWENLSFQTREQTCAPSLEVQSPNHWAAVEVPACVFKGPFLRLQLGPAVRGWPAWPHVQAGKTLPELELLVPQSHLSPGTNPRWDCHRLCDLGQRTSALCSSVSSPGG